MECRKAQTEVDAQTVHLIYIIGELVFHESRQLVESGNIIEGTRASVAVRTVGQSFVLVVVTFARVPVVVIVNTRLETLHGLTLPQEEVVGQFEEEVTGTALGDAGSLVGSGLPRNGIVTRFAGSQDGEQSAADGDIRGVAGVGLRQAES